VLNRPGAGVAPAEEAEAAIQEAIAIRHQFAILKKELAATLDELAAARADAERLGAELEAMKATRGWQGLERLRDARRRLPGQRAR
jgi:hypothetical protein